MSHPSHHHSISKLNNKNSKGDRAVDLMAYVVGVLGNFAVIPQIIKAWQGPSPGLAITTWLIFIAIGIIWLVYAVLHKQKPLILAQVVGLGCNFMVVVGWLINNNL